MYFIRNVPLLAHIYGKVMAECNENMDITGQKEAESYYNFLTNPLTIAFAAEMCQILEDYSESESSRL